MIRRAFRWLFLAGFVFGCAAAVSAEEPEAIGARIVFGSCLNPFRDHEVLRAAIDRDPDYTIFLGDNVYIDTRDPDDFPRSYRVLGESELVRELRRMSRTFAIWDDHDFGSNDAGSDYPLKRVSERAFLDFWEIPRGDPRRERPGIYYAETVGPPGRRVQFILLDTRYFRAPLLRGNPRAGDTGRGPYRAVLGDGGGTSGGDAERTPRDTVGASAHALLGADQWTWLERQLEQPATVRIIASSIQVLAEHHGWESWANAPEERRRLLDAVAGTVDGGTTHVVFLSGDRHFSEVSRRRFGPEGRLIAYDVTSSGINRAYPQNTPITPNRFRVAGPIRPYNVGEIEITWPDGGGKPRLVARVHTDARRPAITVPIPPTAP